MNVERNIIEEANKIQQFKSEAENQYSDGNQSPNVIPPDFHVLFILLKNVTFNGTPYNTTTVHEQIFDESVENFKGCIEAFSNHNVHVVTTKRTITRQITINSTGSYVGISNIDELVNDDFFATGLYDSVIVVTKEIAWGGTTSQTMFELEQYMYGYSHVNIIDTDSALIGHGYKNCIPHLDTTGIIIHEFLHQLESYRTVLSGITYPYTHGYDGSYGYSWNEQYYDNVEHVCAKEYSCYYRAVIACDVTSGSKKIGMYPKFWKITPRKTNFGKYLIQDPNQNNKYIYNNNGSFGYTTNLVNSRLYYWNIYYSMLWGGIKTFNFALSNGLQLIYTGDSSKTITRVGPYDEGSYIFVNNTLSKVLRYNTSAQTLTTENYLTSSYEVFNASYWANGFMTIVPATSQTLFLDLMNGIDSDGNLVKLHTWTNTVTAQTWQFRYDGANYKEFPFASTTRSLSYYNSDLRICPSGNSNAQNWTMENVANGKFLYNGNYYIKTSTGSYLRYNGTSLITGTTPQAWTITWKEDNYYTITVPGGTNVFDVNMGLDYENNGVQLHSPTTYISAQYWKFMLQYDETVKIVPRLSLTRGLSSSTTGSKIVSNPPKWTLEKA